MPSFCTTLRTREMIKIAKLCHWSRMQDRILFEHIHTHTHKTQENTPIISRKRKKVKKIIMTTVFVHPNIRTVESSYHCFLSHLTKPIARGRSYATCYYCFDSYCKGSEIRLIKGMCKLCRTLVSRNKQKRHAEL